MTRRRIATLRSRRRALLDAERALEAIDQNARSSFDSGVVRYIATALHRDEAGRKRHEEMGFVDGWGKALDQLVALAKTW